MFLFKTCEKIIKTKTTILILYFDENYFSRNVIKFIFEISKVFFSNEKWLKNISKSINFSSIFYQNMILHKF